MTERLYRSRDDRMLAGVAAGVADALDADPSIIRIAWALLTILTGGLALVVYIVMAIVVPEAPVSPPSPGAAVPSGAPPSSWADEREARRAARRARRATGQPGNGGLVAGAILIVIGAFFLFREFVPWFNWNLWWPVGLIGLGVLLLIVALSPGRSSD